MNSTGRAILFFMLMIGMPIVLVAIMEGPRRAHTTMAVAPPFPPDSEILSLLRRRVEQRRSAGIVVALLEPGGRSRIIAYGDPGPGQPPLDGNSVFEIGSITKVFTATMLAQMVQEGSLHLDDPAQRFLPADAHLPTREGKQITLAELSEQNSGLPRLPTNMHPANDANPYADYTVQQMYSFLSSYQLTRDPGARFEYSNLGVGLLGNILARHENTTYDALVRTRVLDPLGMTHTAITLTPWMQAHLALGHDDAGAVVSGWDLPALAGAGALRSTALDMLKFLDANLHPTRGPLARAMAFAHISRAPTDTPNLSIGLNWFILHAGADTVIQHNGGTGGYRTFAGFSPGKRIAVVVLTNSGGTGADDIGLHLLSRAIPLSEAPTKAP